MAKNNSNILIYGFSGAVGKQWVLRTIGNHTFLAKRPRKNRSRVPTPAQQAMQLKFREAVIYAKTAIKDASVKRNYQKVAKPGQSAYNIAFRDAIKGPELSRLNTDAYAGNPGDIIKVRARDNFFVNMVQISILDANGALLEVGPAEPHANGLDFSYTVTQSNTSVLGTTIRVIAEDLPRNRAVLEKVL